MPKKDSPRRRLVELIEYEKWLRSRPMVPLHELGRVVNWRDHPIPEMEGDLDRLYKLARQGRDKDSEAFKITGAPKSLKLAFNAFGLNHRDPWHWRHLLIYLAHTQFHKGEPGRPLTSYDFHIIEDYIAASNGAESKTDAVTRMLGLHRYRSVSVPTLTRRLNRAIRKMEITLGH
jgi:hypothetical protein